MFTLQNYVNSGSKAFMNGIYLITGSNQGERLVTLNSAKDQLEKHVGVLKKASAIYETAPWGKTDQAPFLNQVLFIETELEAPQVLEACLSIERQHGRIRKKQWEARTLDIDILFFGNEVIIEEGLIVPHPHLHERRFVLAPLMELAPELVHPVLNLSVTQLLNLCEDHLPVSIYSE